MRHDIDINMLDDETKLLLRIFGYGPKPRRYKINLRKYSAAEKARLKSDVINLYRSGKNAMEIAEIIPMNIVTIQEWIQGTVVPYRLRQRGRRPKKLLTPANQKHLFKNVFKDIYNDRSCHSPKFWSYTDIQELMNKYIEIYLEQFKKDKYLLPLDYRGRFPVDQKLSLYYVKKIVSEVLNLPPLAAVKSIFNKEYRDPVSQKNITYSPKSKFRWFYIMPACYDCYYRMPKTCPSLWFHILYSPRGDIQIVSAPQDKREYRYSNTMAILNGLYSKAKNRIILIHVNKIQTSDQVQ